MADTINSNSQGKINPWKQKLDKLFNVIKCECKIQTCKQLKCDVSCDKNVHIDSMCKHSVKIPVSELSFVYFEREKIGSRGKYQIGRVDTKEAKANLKRKQR